MAKILLLFAAVVAVQSATLEDLIVETKAGLVQGTQGSTIEGNQPYYAFRGIPYAEPPIGSLRFEPSVPKAAWSGVVDATQDRPHCVQGSDPVDGVEDCLHINVYTPVKPSSSQRLPTMVWIYGGGFEGGTSNYETYGPDHILEQGVVVVSFNYRLGFLGFFSTGDLVAPGNNGLKDQLLALKWVRENIAAFGGNPDDVTIAGQSAGSVSVAYHIQSPLSQGLFHKAILESGVSLSLFGYSRRVPEVVKLVAAELKVSTDSSQSIVDGLKALDVTSLQTTAASIITKQYLANNPREGFQVGPVTEPDHANAFISGLSHERLSKGDFTKVPILIGFNSLEGTYNFELVFRLYLVQFDLDKKKLLPDLNINTAVATTAANELKTFYFSWLPVSLSNTELMNFLSDDQFVRSIREFARLVSKHVKTYLYRFSYEGGLWGFQNRTVSGVTHSEELGYYWVSKHEPTSAHDLVVRDRLIKLITNFVKTSNPTPATDALLENVIWDPVDDNLSYLDIGANLIKGTHPQKTVMDFWDSFIAKYGNPPYNVY